MSITIDVTITMGEDSKIMSLEEAKMLYTELGKMFSTNIHSQHSQPRHDDIYSNPTVEAAKAKAKARTSGCGAKRS